MHSDGLRGDGDAVAAAVTFYESAEALPAAGPACTFVAGGSRAPRGLRHAQLPTRLQDILGSMAVPEPADYSNGDFQASFMAPLAVAFRGHHPRCACAV